METIKVKVSELPKVGDIGDFEVFGVDKSTGESARADMAQLRGNEGAQGEPGPKGDKGDPGLGAENAVQFIPQTLTEGQKVQARTNLSLDSVYVNQTGAQTIAGAKTFSSIPVLPASNPTTANQAVRKGYVDGLIGDINAALDSINRTVV